MTLAANDVVVGLAQPLQLLLRQRELVADPRAKRDQRSPTRLGILPGAIAVTQDVAIASLPAIDDDTHLVIYCACPNEISAALLAERLQRDGVRHTYALLGGLAAWHAAQEARPPPA